MPGIGIGLGIGPFGAGSMSHWIPANAIEIAGESTLVGFADNADAAAWEVGLRPELSLWDNIGGTSFITPNIGVNSCLGCNLGISDATVHGIEVSLANAIRDGLYPGYSSLHPLSIIKTGWGGSTIADWVFGGTRWNVMAARYAAAIAVLGPNVKWETWFAIGVNDGQAGTNVATYKAAVIAHFAARRTLMGVNTVIRVLKLPDPGANQYAAYDTALRQICAADTSGNTVFVETSGCDILNTDGHDVKGDQLHYNYYGHLRNGRLLAHSAVHNTASPPFNLLYDLTSKPYLRSVDSWDPTEPTSVTSLSVFQTVAGAAVGDVGYWNGKYAAPITVELAAEGNAGIRIMADYNSNTNLLQTGDPSIRPTLRYDGSAVRYYMHFDGVDDLLTWTKGYSNPLTLGFNLRLTNGAGSAFGNVFTALNDFISRMARNSGADSQFFIRSALGAAGYLTVTPTTSLVGQWASVIVVLDGASGTTTLDLYFGGSPATESYTSASAAAALTSTGLQINDGLCGCDIADLILFSGNINGSPTEKSKALAWLWAANGVGGIPAPPTFTITGVSSTRITWTCAQDSSVDSGIFEYSANSDYSGAITLNAWDKDGFITGDGYIDPLTPATTYYFRSRYTSGPYRTASQATSAPGPNRTVSGFVFADDFADLSNWDLHSATEWTTDSANPQFTYWQHDRTLLSLSGGAAAYREPLVLIPSAGNLYVYYDKGKNDGTVWTTQLATSTDGGLTLSVQGAMNFPAVGSYEEYSPGFIFVSGGVWYFYVMGSTSHDGAGTPAQPYYNHLFKSSSTNPDTAATWTSQSDNDPALGAGGGDHDAEFAPVTSILNDSGTYNAYVSANDGGSTFGVGVATASGALGSWTFSTASLLPSNVRLSTNQQENPRIIYSSVLGRYAMLCNTIDITHNPYELGGGIWYSDTIAHFATSGQVKMARVVSPVDTYAAGAFNFWSPIYQNDMTVTAPESDGTFGVVASAAPTLTANAYGHNLYAGALEPHANCLRVQGSSYDKTITAAPSMPPAWVMECVFEYGTVANANIGILFCLSNPSGTIGNVTAYYLDTNQSGANALLYQGIAGSYTQLGSTLVVPQATFTADSINGYHARVRVTWNGTTVTVGVAGKTTSASPGSPLVGTGIGFRAANLPDGRVRGLRVYKSDTVTFTGLPASAAVALCGANGLPAKAGTADGSGNLTLSHSHYPMYGIRINGTLYTPATGKIWGGDTYLYG